MITGGVGWRSHLADIRGWTGLQEALLQEGIVGESVAATGCLAGYGAFNC